MFRTFINSIIAVVVLCSADAFAADSSKPSYMLEMVTPYSVRVLKNSCDEKLYGVPADDNCTRSPVTTGTMSVACGDAVHKITDPLQGVFSLPSSRVGYLENMGKKTDIIWEYEGTRITTTSNFTPDEKQQTIKMYLDKLAAEKLLTLQLGEHSDFDRSGTILFDKIRSSLPKYYRLKRSEKQSTQNRKEHGAGFQEDSAAYDLVPAPSRMFYKYGGYTGVVELVNIGFSDVPAPVVLKTNIINNVLPAFRSEDDNVKIVCKDSVLHVTNKSDSSLTLKRVSLYYDGIFIDHILDRPIELAPAATSDISLASVIGKDLKLDVKHSAMSAQEAWEKKVNFGFGVVYGHQSSASALLSRVTTSSAYELAENAVETALLVEHMESLTRVESAGKVAAPSKVQYDFTMEFAFGKASVKPEYLYKLETVGQAMQKLLNIKGIIEGHSDNVGSRAVNQRISELRADVAKQYLVKKYSIDPVRIQTKGFGMTKPIADNGTPGGRAQNRRIEARFVGADD
ncbi:MAG: hypothetical protein A2076_15760 [Geobacteraceae bacterium GWC2_53_11]|nr:MAG: hypothetical protein A2076_15760 [Geobacteraceae bacterium GWC2_53_11]